MINISLPYMESGALSNHLHAMLLCTLIFVSEWFARSFSCQGAFARLFPCSGACLGLQIEIIQFSGVLILLNKKLSKLSDMFMVVAR